MCFQLGALRLTVATAVPSRREASERLNEVKREHMAKLCRTLFLMAVLLPPSLAQAQEEKASSTVDTEHIFGFTEGSDIGEKGEKEVDHGSNFFVGKRGSLIDIENETAFATVSTTAFALRSASSPTITGSMTRREFRIAPLLASAASAANLLGRCSNATKTLGLRTRLLAFRASPFAP